ncbi:MAG: SsrA-binding protein SmpB [Candidatus Scalindua sp. AMX11]|nr:MAG: SsrA-binding protein SmpB [Candidatus Scalindua sp.]NOG84425.1 SsrA-binding protein SmpB [Planctomycetota bacterium]RZV72460.1 MAG: SsrA-binding protein SmpB [Candidatus Scalindua sp. SCAELEC01]TDE64615.1 MAG: SsrA-binding protein SmpB [Candidatus Scalindua sp. AMX11]GJQ59712.1 MAG: SsrA-binding protein [Candidatus Scalindua sp.]
MEIISKNKKAHFNYEILERFEAGISLKGTEVKSIRNGNISLDESYAQIKDDEVFLLNLYVSPYEQGNRENHVPTRVRKLLLHRQEIRKLIGKIQQKGLSLLPLALYIKNGIIKVELALGRGKRLVDKREDMKKKSVEREMDRFVKK